MKIVCWLFGIVLILTVIIGCQILLMIGVREKVNSICFLIYIGSIIISGWRCYPLFFNWRLAMSKKLEVGDVLKEGISIGLKNAGPMIVNVLLWILTIWIPYLNVGTTIGLFVGVIAKASKGEPIAMAEIFNPDYRKYMGDFFLTAGLMSIGISIGFALFIGPGIVLALAWSLALLLAVDKGKNPTEALNLSNKITYGNKGTMFLAYLILFVAFAIIMGILSLLGEFGLFIAFIAYLLFIFIQLGINAKIYKELSADI